MRKGVLVRVKGGVDEWLVEMGMLETLVLVTKLQVSNGQGVKIK